MLPFFGIRVLADSSLAGLMVLATAVGAAASLLIASQAGPWLAWRLHPEIRREKHRRRLILVHAEEKAGTRMTAAEFWKSLGHLFGLSVTFAVLVALCLRAVGTSLGVDDTHGTAFAVFVLPFVLVGFLLATPLWCAIRLPTQSALRRLDAATGIAERVQAAWWLRWLAAETFAVAVLLQLTEQFRYDSLITGVAVAATYVFLALLFHLPTALAILLLYEETLLEPHVRAVRGHAQPSRVPSIYATSPIGQAARSRGGAEPER